MAMSITNVLSFFSGAVSVFLAIITIPGNFLVCLAFLRDPFHELRTSFSCLLFGLASTDLMVGIVLDPLSAAFHFSEGLQSDLINIKALHILFFIFCSASILILSALTLDRCCAVCLPLKYKTLLTPRRAFIATAVIWVLALGTSMAYFKLEFIIYSFIFVNTSVLCTTLVLLFTCVCIYKRLHAQIKTFHRPRQDAATDTREKNKEQKLNSMEKEKKATKTLGLVLLAFFLCFTPACIMIYVLKFCKQCSCFLYHWLRDLHFVIVLLNSGINPFLYAWRMPQIKRALRMPASLRSVSPVRNVVLDITPQAPQIE